jgi:predicted P-loop ATPase/GTPase
MTKSRMSKDEGADAAKTKRQVDNAVCWLQKRYFTEEVIAKRFNESAAPFFKVNKNDRKSRR